MSSTGGLLGGALDPQGPMARSAAALWWLMAALLLAPYRVMLPRLQLWVPVH